MKDKYDRRIHRFLLAIKKPTLFIAYISSEQITATGKNAQLDWIEKNHDYILSTLRKYNSESDIIYIGNEEVKSEVINIYHVSKDDGDQVARHPIQKKQELFSMLQKIPFSQRDVNLAFYRRNILKKKIRKTREKITRYIAKIFLKEYVYSKNHCVNGY